jgi:hypothetical protein
MGKRFEIRTAVRIAVVIVAVGATAAIAQSSEPPAWQRALQLRSEALDQRYVRHADIRRPASRPAPDWLAALQLRSEGLDRRYGLGTPDRHAQGTTGPDWQRALMERSDALDRRYHLGRYAGSS